jgi:hypothetical protein
MRRACNPLFDDIHRLGCGTHIASSAVSVASHPSLVAQTRSRVVPEYGRRADF